MTLEWGTLAVQVELVEDKLPTEFRIFRAGLNTSLNGDYLFDDEAAQDVMAAFRAHGVDGSVDLEHLSLDDKSPNYDPDARGWYKDLELRDGELWGVLATWTPDGERRLRDRTQRYLSPTFPYDKETRRVKWLHNVALTATPALNGIPALIAARVNLTAGSPAEGVALMAQDNTKAVADILKAVGLDPKMPAKVASALGLDAGASLDEISGAISKFAEMVRKAEELLEGEPSAPDAAPAAPAADTSSASSDTSAPVATASSSTAKLLSAVEALSARLAKQDADAAAAAEARERTTLVSDRKWPTELLDWAGDASTPIAEVRRLAAKFPLAEAPVAGAAGAEQGTRGAGQTTGGLSDRELAICKETGCKPETFAELKARREAARAARS